MGPGQPGPARLQTGAAPFFVLSEGVGRAWGSDAPRVPRPLFVASAS